MRLLEDKIWAGTETSLDAAMVASQGIAVKLAAGQVDYDEDDAPRLLEVSDGVATITIRGSLTNNDSPLNALFGVTSYGEIREAMLSAAEDASVKQIMLDIDSGGGAVNGVADTANLIRTVNDRIKPVTAFTDGTMASAAYWLGSSAGSVVMGKSAVVGSIGVLSVHTEYSKALEAEGVTKTVVRAGSEKALANSIEPLSAKGRASIQALVDSAYEVFVDHVANMRGASYAHADMNMAQGREFIGESAVKAGLVDAINSFDQVMGLLKSKAIDSSNNFMDNRGKPNRSIIGQAGTNLSGEPDMGVKNKQALTEQDIAALAAGASALKVGEEIVAEAGGSVADAEDEAGKTIESAVSTEAAKEAVDVVAEKVANFDATIQLLNSQLAAKDEALLQAGIKLAKLEESAALVTASAGPLLEIVCKSINNMQVALNSPALDMSAMAPAQVLAEHGRWTAQFADKFKVGGVAAVTSEVSAKNEQAPLDAMAKARLDAVRFSR